MSRLCRGGSPAPGTTCSLRVGDAREEDVEKPLQGVLVHGVHVGQVRYTKEKDLRADSHGDVLHACEVNVLLRLLRDPDFGLEAPQVSGGQAQSAEGGRRADVGRGRPEAVGAGQVRPELQVGRGPS